MQYIFKRIEKKYIISKEQFYTVLKKITPFTCPDKYGENDVCNIYCDTDDFKVIRASILKPIYKEKLRLRCYGIPVDNSQCFLELKKKYKKVVYKRRIKTNYNDALEYIQNKSDNVENCQIKNEIEYFRQIFHGLKPKICIFYKRKAFYDKNDRNVRITFDNDILYRDYDLNLKNGIYGESALEKNKYIMEIKTAGAMPLWLVEILSEEKIYPTSFSKYGTAYTIMLNNSELKEIFHYE